MACLQYEPSPVVFDSKKFERIQLVEAQGHLLYLAIEQMQHLDFDVVERRLLGNAADSLKDTSTHKSRRLKPSTSFNYSLLGTPSIDDDASISRELKALHQVIKKTNSHEELPPLGSPQGKIKNFTHLTTPSIADESMTQDEPADVHRRRQSKLDHRLISLTKAREYAKLAHQIPNVLTI